MGALTLETGLGDDLADHVGEQHEHPGGQVLYVASGAGKVQTRDGETVVVRAGDIVHAPPGEVHWHGSLASSYMMHLSLTTGGATQWHEEKVSDADYAA